MLDARQLEALAAVIEHGSFKIAAQALSLTLAAVSLRVKSLEATLGQRLLVRGKKVHATPSGQALPAHVKQLRLMEADLLDALPGASARGPQMQSLSVAVNADSMASWFLPGVAPACKRHRLLFDVVVDDQDHTHDAWRRQRLRHDPRRRDARLHRRAAGHHALPLRGGRLTAACQSTACCAARP
jgi:LysR family transcriptional regulator, chromosome initiation inhibitor